MEQTKNYYTVATPEENPTNLPSELKDTTGFEEIIGQDGLIQVQVEEKVVITRLGKDIYKEPTAGLREFFNNEARQCRTAEKLGHHPRIKITLNPTNRSLVIHGIDSMGMTKQVFKDVYVVVGRSDNFAGDESGQFGFGRIAYLSLTDVVVIETYARETGEKYAFLGKSGHTYEPMSVPDLQEFGTRVSLTVRPEISIYKLAKYAEEIARFAGVNVFLNVESHIKKIDGDRDEYRYEDAIEPGQYQIGPMEEKKFLIENEQASKESYWIEIDNPDYRLVATYGHSYNAKFHHYLIGIPIEMNEIPNPGFGAYVLNIKNERKYMPTASRDNLSSEAEQALSEKITEDLQNIFRQIDITSIKDYVDSPHKPLIRNSHDMSSPFDVFPNLTQQFAQMMRQSIHTYTWDSKEKKKHHTSYGASMETLVSKVQELYYSYNANDEKLDALLEKCKNATVIVPQGRSHQRKYTIMLMERFGITPISKKLAELGIKFAKERTPSSNEIVVHDRHETIRMRSDELQDKDIRIPNYASLEFREYLRIFRSGNFGYRLVRDAKKLVGGVLLKDFVEKAKKDAYGTSKGLLSGTKIISLIQKWKEDSYEIKSIAYISECHKYYKEIDMNLCKKVLPDVKLLIKDPVKETQLRLLLALEQLPQLTQVEKEYEFAKIFAEKLGIGLEGAWIQNLENTGPTLQKLSKRMQTMYVRCYDKLFKHNRYSSYGIFSDSERPEITPPFNELLLQLDEKTKGKSEQDLLQICFEFVPDGENGEDKIAKMHSSIREVISEDFKKAIEKLGDAAKGTILKNMYFGKLAEKVSVKFQSTNDEITVALANPTGVAISFDGKICKKIRDETGILRYGVEVENITTNVSNGKTILTVVMR